MKTVTIFGSSLPSENSTSYAEARRLGRLLAERGLVVCNGGYTGLMEASSRGAREAGGHTIGVTCSIWPSAPNRWIAEEVRTRSFSERIITLIERGDAYIALPGGTGTLAELALAWEIMNKSSLSRRAGGHKPLLVMEAYWKPVIDCLKQEPALASPGADRRPTAMDLITLVSSINQAADSLASDVFRVQDSP
jgi:uncharacterized protein (TIGR00730 family)